ncbi:MAG: nuclear transport factor 2 family protein [Xanthomonadales bacterium]|jgi:hypothetical protein|nr:nuclear transport factor 2 family protein [Xanthomonadales bacterium]
MKPLLTLSILPLLLLSNAVQAEDFASPSDAVNAYITGVKSGSGTHIEQAFADGALIQYYDDKGDYRVFTRDEFAGLVDQGDDWDADIEITELPVTGNAANATVAFTWGEDAQHGYVDYLNLIYADGSWRIANKVAQYISR